jgi:hypothetical protein
MKHIKKFENFSFEEEEKYGRFAQERESDVAEFGEEGNEFNEDDFDQQDCDTCDSEENDDINQLGEEEDDYGFSDEEEEEEENQAENRIRRWGDEEVLEKKKMNPGFKAYLDKQKAKSKGKEDDKKGGKGKKPDFLDLDKDGDKKEPMKKAAKDAKEDDKGTAKKGLTAAQKKLPKALQDSILKKQK